MFEDLMFAATIGLFGATVAGHPGAEPFAWVALAVTVAVALVNVVKARRGCRAGQW